MIIHKKNLFYFEGDKIIDVLCHGEYENNQTLSFTDVHRDFIRRGIARELINELNNYIDMKRPFYLSKLTESGKEANIDKVFENIIKTEVKTKNFIKNFKI